MIEETAFGLLRTEDFVQTENIPNTKAEILRFEVPDHVRMTLLTEKPIEVRFMTSQEFMFTTVAGQTTHTVTLNGDMQDSPDLANVGDAVIIKKWLPHPVEEWFSANLNYPGNTITFTGLTEVNTYRFEVFYMFGGGVVEMEVIDPTRRVRRPFFASTTDLINRRRQIDDRTAMSLPRAETVFPRYLVSIFLTAALPVSFDPMARNTVVQLFYSSAATVQ